MKIKLYIDDHCNVYTEKTLEGVIQERLAYVKEWEIDKYCDYWIDDLAQEGKELTLNDVFIIDDEKKVTYSNSFSTWLMYAIREEVIDEMLIREVEI